MTEKNSNQIRAASSQHFVRTVSRAQTVSQEASASVFASKPPPGPSLVKNTYGGFSTSSAHLGRPNFCNQQTNDGRLQRKSESLSGLEAREHSPLFVQPALGNGSQQKGPRIANVVHRFKSSVELLEIGAVLSGRLWSSSQAIFPKGLFFSWQWIPPCVLQLLFNLEATLLLGATFCCFAILMCF